MDPTRGPERPSRDGFRVLDAWVEPELDRLTRDGASLHLEPKLTEVLLLLSKHQGRVVSKEKILETVWPNQFVAESTLSRAIAELRRVLGDDAQKPRFIETIPRRGYRLIAPVERADAFAPAVPVAAVLSPTPAPLGASPAVADSAKPAATLRDRRVRWGSGVGLALIAVVGLAFVLYSRAAAPAISETDIVLITDFENTTGEPLFDDTLKQAFVIQIEQSPYFSLFPANRIRDTLEMMRRPPDERLTPALAREICERNGIAAMLVGSLAPLGASYVITLQAISARTGETLAREQAQALNKEGVLSALGGAASKLRRKLGESRASIERFDKPLVEATTSSLEALRFYTEGQKFQAAGKWADAIPFYLKALELDPEIARAHFSLGAAYRHTWDRASARRAFLRAFELRDRVTELERYDLTHSYNLLLWEGHPLAARQTLELAVRAYPRYVKFRVNLAAAYRREGKYEEAVEQSAEGMRLVAGTGGTVPHFEQAYGLFHLGRYEEAKRTLAEVDDDADTHSILLQIAYAEGDQPALRRELDWWRNQEPSGFALFTAQLGLFEGRRTQQAVAADPEAWGVALAMADLAALSAALGDCDGAGALLRSIPGDKVDGASGVATMQAVAYALCGDTKDAQQTLTRFEKAPLYLGSVDRIIRLPVAEAILELSRGDFVLARAKLEPALGFQLGEVDGFWTNYVLGLGYLGERRPAEAGAAFEKILANRSVDPTSPLYPLSYLGLARASTLSGDTARARRAYEELLAIWIQADPDLPALVAARAEYAALM